MWIYTWSRGDEWLDKKHGIEILIRLDYVAQIIRNIFCQTVEKNYIKLHLSLYSYGTDKPRQIIPPTSSTPSADRVPMGICSEHSPWAPGCSPDRLWRCSRCWRGPWPIHVCLCRPRRAWRTTRWRLATRRCPSECVLSVYTAAGLATRSVSCRPSSRICTVILRTVCHEKSQVNHGI